MEVGQDLPPACQESYMSRFCSAQISALGVSDSQLKFVTLFMTITNRTYSAYSLEE
jgi:hypothetical protein